MSALEELINARETTHKSTARSSHHRPSATTTTTSHSLAIKSSNHSSRKGSMRSTPYEDHGRTVESTRDRDSRPRPDCSLKMLLTNAQAGTLIGNGGSSVRELMEITEAAVHVSSHGQYYPGTKERTIYITGTEASVTLAQSLVWEMIGQQAHAARRNEVLAWDPTNAKRKPGQFDDIEVSGFITIPGSAAGGVFGRGGATIRSISEDSGVEIVLDSKEDGEVTQERVVTLNGSCAGCMKATALVLKKMVEFSQTNYLVNGTGYHPTRAARNREDSRDEDSPPNTGRSVSLAADKSSSLFGPISRPGTKMIVAETLSANTTIELAVPDSLIGILLGVQGATLNEIISLSGAKVFVSKRGEFVEGTNNRLVTIVGSPACAQTAHTLIVHKLKHDD